MLLALLLAALSYALAAGGDFTSVRGGFEPASAVADEGEARLALKPASGVEVVARARSAAGGDRPGEAKTANRTSALPVWPERSRALPASVPEKTARKPARHTPNGPRGPPAA